MKYNIYINQLILHKTNLNIVDCALLDYLYIFCNSLNPEIDMNRMVDKNGIKWTWIDYGRIIRDMPLLGVKNKSGLTRHFAKLEKNGFIVSKIWFESKKYVRLLQKTEELYIQSDVRMTNVIPKNDVGHTIIVSDVSIVDNVDNGSNVSNGGNAGNDGNVSKTHVIRKLNYVAAEKLCTTRRVEDGCGKCANCSWTVCSPNQLYQLALEEEVAYEDVKRIHNGLITWIESKRMKDATVFRTLRNWIQRDVNKGNIKHLNYMDLEMMKLKFDTKLRSKLEAIHNQLEKGEI